MFRWLFFFLLSSVSVAAQSSEAFVRKEAFLRLKLSKTSCFEGEPVLASYELYRSLQTQSRVVKQPNFAGFGVQELTTNAEVQTEQELNGKFYKVDVVRKVILTPLQAGRFVLDSVVVEHVVPVPELGRNLVVQVGNPPQTLMVKPLPANAEKAAIGRYQLSASFTQPELWAGGTDTLVVCLSGEGNFARLPPPNLQWPAGTRAYAMELDEDSVDRLSFPPTGSVRFLIPFTLLGSNARLPQEVTIQQFDPATGAATTLRASLPTLQRIARPGPAPLPPPARPAFYAWLPALALIPLVVAFLLFALRSKKGRRPKAMASQPPGLAITSAAIIYQHEEVVEKLAGCVDEPANFLPAAEAALLAYRHAQPAAVPHEWQALSSNLQAARFGGKPLDGESWLKDFAQLPH